MLPTTESKDRDKTGETYTEEEKGERGRNQKIADLVGQLKAMSEYVKERGGRPLPEEVKKARRLVGQLKGLGFRPRKLGLSLRQLGLNPKASKYRPPNPATWQFEDWQDKARACIQRSDRLSGWELDFIAGVGRVLERGRGLTEKQADYLYQIFDKIHGR